MTTATSLQTIELDPGVPARATVVVLHGLGADGTDFLPVADQLDLAAVGPVRWLFPRAPVRPVTINGGYRMRAWYDILGADLVKREDEAGLRESILLVQQLLQREAARGVPASRTVLAGFSQGSAITLGAGLRHADRLAGLVGMSGYVPLAESTAAERHPANAATPVFLAHGRNDGIVPLARGQSGRDLLLSLGQPVQWQDYPMEHAVCAEEVEALQAFLQRVLA
jgi:phospholipase/carboxylesterase